MTSLERDDILSSKSHRGRPLMPQDYEQLVDGDSSSKPVFPQREGMRRAPKPNEVKDYILSRKLPEEI